ncbi:MAG: hypothetical protein WA510_29010 [Acidobacteriaceae bacterium]
MTIEPSDLSISGLDRMDPVSPTPAGQGQSSLGESQLRESQSKQRRRAAPLPPDAASPETPEHDPEHNREQDHEPDPEPESEPLEHRVDKLA